MKKRYKIFFAVLILVTLLSTGKVAADLVTQASNISLSSDKTSKIKVSEALDELYDNTLNKINEAKAECPSGKECYAIGTLDAEKRKFKIGDYVKMTPSFSGSYTIPTSESSYSSSQTITPSELNIWRIITVKATGEVEMVSQYASSTNVRLGTTTGWTSTVDATHVDVIGYQNVVKWLNTIASKYTNSTYVSATRSMGYNSGLTTEQITTATQIISTTAPWSVTTTKGGATREDQGGGDLGYLVDVEKVQNAIGTLNTTTPSGGETNYWIASRHYNKWVYNNYDHWQLATRYIHGNNSQLDYDVFLYHDSSRFIGYSNAHSIRPIVTLKSNVKISGGYGTESEPYTLTV